MKIPRLPWYARAAGSALMLALVLALLPVDHLWDALRGVEPAVWITTVFLYLLGHCVAAFKWRLLMGRTRGLGAGLVLRAHFAGLLSNIVLPGLAGGDVVRAAVMVRGTERLERVAVASAADRLIDSIGCLLLAFGGALWTAHLYGPAGKVLVASAVVLLGVVALLGVGYLYMRRRPAAGLAGRLAATLGELARRPALPLAALVLSMAVQAAFVVLNARLGRAVGVDVALGAWLFAVPLAKLVATIPVTVAGLGVREAAVVVFMRPFGAPAAGVMAASLLWTAVVFVGGLVAGGLAVLSAGSTTLPRRNRGAEGKLDGRREPPEPSPSAGANADARAAGADPRGEPVSPVRP